MRFTFLCPSGLECWDHSRPVGIAGSETCVAEISRRLAKRGHEVLVYAPVFPDTEDDPNDGHPVKWGHIHESDIDIDAPGVWWLCRHPPLADFFEGRPDQQLFLRCDDIHYGTGDCPSAMTEARAAKFKHILCMSEPHKHYFLQAYPFLDPGKISTLGCGIASDRMMQLPFVDRDPYRLIWVSSPDRGLDSMIRIFHQARKQEPRLNLHVYYGWDGCEKASRGNPNDPRMKLKRWCTEVADQTNITWHGRVGKEELWRGHLSSTILPYPTQFAECLVGDTKIETTQGRVAIKELVGKSDFPVYSCNANGGLSLSNVKWVAMTQSNAPVVRLRLRPGIGRNARKEKTLVLTPNHEVMLVTGEYKAAGDLRPGDRVKAFSRRENGWGLGYSMIGLTGRPMIPEHRFVASHVAGRPLTDEEVVDHYPDEDTRNNHPQNLVIRASHAAHSSAHWQRDWDGKRAETIDGLRSFIAANREEYTAKLSEAQKRRWANMSDEDRRDWLQRQAEGNTPEVNAARARATKERNDATWGNSPWRDRETLYRLYVVAKKSTVEIATELGGSSSSVTHWLKRHGIPIRSFSESQLVKREASNHIVVSVEDAGFADVYCMETDPDHNFVANGIVVHNCGVVSVQEAQALGAIPVCPPFAGLAEKVKNGVFILSDPADPGHEQRYVDSILALVRDPDLCHAIREAMQPWALETYSWDRIVDHHEFLAGHPWVVSVGQGQGGRLAI